MLNTANQRHYRQLNDAVFPDFAPSKAGNVLETELFPESSQIRIFATRQPKPLSFDCQQITVFFFPFRFCVLVF